MDHKVSKDMISSGMIPSGEKTQADLGRTQYGSAPSPSSLMEAYRSIYEHHQKDENGNTIPHKDEEINEEDIHEVVPQLAVAAGGLGVAAYGGKLMYDAYKEGKKKKPAEVKPIKTTTEGKMPEGLKNYLMKKGKKKDDKKEMKEMNDVDLFDLVKGKLIDEGCEEKEAINIMINLSEDELNEILGGVKGDGYIGHPRLGIKNPINPPKKETKKTNGGSGLTNRLGNRATEIEKMIQGM